jgi:excisionase family DNA binding protein
MNSTTEKEKYLTSKELAEALNIHLQTIELLVKRGCPVLYVGKVRRFLLSEVTEYLKEEHGRKSVE